MKEKTFSLRFALNDIQRRELFSGEDSSHRGRAELRSQERPGLQRRPQ